MKNWLASRRGRWLKMVERDLSETAFTNEDVEKGKDFVVCSVDASGIPRSQILAEAFDDSMDKKIKAKENFFWIGIIISSIYFISILVM